jgi:type VI secretion system protein ImpA
LVDVPLLLAAVSANAPCGDDLEYDAEFLQLERDAQGKPERSMGDAVLPAEPPQWRQIQQVSTALLQRSKDLRVTHFLLQSTLALDGVPGLSGALVLIRSLLQQYWPNLYPLLDADDGNDPTVRVNALAGIACETNVRLLRESILIRSRVFGPITLRAALNASGAQIFHDEKLTADELAGALLDADVEQLQAMREAVSQARDAASQIEALVAEQVGSAQGVDFSSLKQPLRLAQQILGDSTANPGETRPAVVDTHQVDTSVAYTDVPMAARSPARISSREDVLGSLDLLLDYYARHEPSSPLPVLLNRARLLVNADFATIVRNLIPDGMSQFESLRGPDTE